MISDLFKQKRVKTKTKIKKQGKTRHERQSLAQGDKLRSVAWAISVFLKQKGSLMKTVRKKQEDRLLKRMPRLERQRQEHIRKLISSDVSFSLT